MNHSIIDNNLMTKFSEHIEHNITNTPQLYDNNNLHSQHSVDEIALLRNKIVGSCIFNFLVNVSTSTYSHCNNTPPHSPSHYFTNGFSPSHVEDNHLHPSNHINGDTTALPVNSGNGSREEEQLQNYQALLIEYMKGISPTIQFLPQTNKISDSKSTQNSDINNLKILQSIFTSNNFKQPIPDQSNNYHHQLTDSNNSPTSLHYKISNGDHPHDTIPNSANFPQLISLDPRMKIFCVSFIFDEFIWNNHMLGKSHSNKYYSNSTSKLFSIIEETAWMSQNLQECKESRKNIFVPPKIINQALLHLSSTSGNFTKHKRKSSHSSSLNNSDHNNHDSGSLKSLLPVRHPNHKSSDHKPKRRHRGNYSHADISSLNSCVPFNAFGTSKIEPINYTEILTPNWKPYQFSHPSPSNNHHDHSSLTNTFNTDSNSPDTATTSTTTPINLNCAYFANQEEDLSDEAYIERHSKLEIEERKKYMMALSTARRYKRKMSSDIKNRTMKGDKKVYQDPSQSVVTITLYNEDSVSQLF